MSNTKDFIELATKKISRYEIYIEASDFHNSMRFPIKTKKSY